MKLIGAGAILCVALAAGGCASMPSAAEQQAADYGSPIVQDAAEALAKEYIETRLKDPMSAVYRWNPVYKGFVGNAPVMGRKAAFGYMLEGTVNAKNSFGGYTGAKPYAFLFHNGSIVYASAQECLSPGSCYMAPLP